MSSITCEPRTLADALAAVKPCVSKNSAFQAMTGVKINSHVDGVFLHATNFDIHALRRMDAEVDGTVNLVAPHGLLSDAVKLFAKFDSLTLTQGEDELVVASGRRRITLRTLRLEDFPAMPEQGGRVIVHANGDELGRVIERAGKFNSKDETRPVLTGLNLSWEHDRLELCATDTYRLGVFVVPGEQMVSKVQNPDGNSVNIPGAGLLIAAKAMKKQQVTVLANDTHTIVEVPDLTFALRSIDGQYPNYRQLMPDTWNHDITVPVCELVDACEVANKFLTKNAPARLYVNGVVKLHGCTPDVGEFSEILEGANARLDSEEFEIGLNPEFLRDIAKLYASETAVIRGISPLKPVLFEDNEDRYLLMPIRLNVCWPRGRA